MENKRITFYRSLLEVYTCFGVMRYDSGIYILENILKDVNEMCKQTRYYEYIRRRMEYSRPIPKTTKPMQKKFVEWFHKAMFNISKNHYIYSYSYIRDMKTILERLNDNNRAS